uniref:Suppressor of white apricot N-terminal domain-containing protein n=1 Tax=Ascaris lumbricoides TaxID=6252 RepID=A0A9J2QBC5_ASCLU
MEEPSVDVEELQCDYERYRILILNDFDRVSERTFLKEIAAKEFWPGESASTNRIELEKKKHSRDKKAAVAFSYEDTTTVKGSTQSQVSDSSDDEDEIIEPDEFASRWGLSRCKKAFSNTPPQFKLFAESAQRNDGSASHREGRQAKAERALLKKKRSLIVGKGCLNEEATTTLLSFVTQNMKQYEESELKTRHSSSPEDLSGVASTSGSVKRRARSKSPMRRMRSKSRERANRRDRMRSRSRSRTRSSRGRSRSSEESRSRERSYHSASKTDDGRRRRKSPSSPSRRRTSASNERKDSDRRLRRSSSRESDRLISPPPGQARVIKMLQSRRTSASNERKDSDRRLRRSSSRESDRLISPPPGQARGTGSILSPSRSDGDMSPLEIRSSMSESERERIEVENRRRRIRRTAKMHRSL